MAPCIAPHRYQDAEEGWRMTWAFEVFDSHLERVLAYHVEPLEGEERARPPMDASSYACIDISTREFKGVLNLCV